MKMKEAREKDEKDTMVEEKGEQTRKRDGMQSNQGFRLWKQKWKEWKKEEETKER
jgi:hypothetical protein